MRALGLAIEVGADQRQLVAGIFAEIDPVAGRTEMRFAAFIGDPPGLAAGDVEQIDARLNAPGAGGQPAAAAGFVDHEPAIGRELRAAIMAGGPADRARLAAACADHAQLAQPRIIPADIDDLAAIARKGREELEIAAAIGDQSLRSAAGCRLLVQLAQSLKHHAAAIGRDAGKAWHADRHQIGRDRFLRADRVDDRARIVDAERDHARLAAGNIDRANLAARPEHQPLAVGHPAHVRIHAVHRPGFLHVAVHIVIDLALLAALHVADIELGLGPFAADKGKIATIGRRLGPRRAAGASCDALDLAARHVIAVDHEDLRVAVLRIFEDRAGGRVLAVIDARPIMREDRFAQLLLVRLAGALDERHAVASADMIEPQLAGAERAPGGEMLARDDILAIGAPARVVEQAEAFLGQLALVRSVGVHDPDIVPSAAIRGKGDAAAIGREARMLFIGQPLGDPGRRAAADRHGVDVAEQVEDDAAAIRADIQVHPGALVDLDRDGAGVHRRRIDVPGGGLVRRSLLRKRRHGDGERRKSDGKTQCFHDDVPRMLIRIRGR